MNTAVRRRYDVSARTYQVGRYFVDHLPNREVVCTCGRERCGYLRAVLNYRGRS